MIYFKFHAFFVAIAIVENTDACFWIVKRVTVLAWVNLWAQATQVAQCHQMISLGTIVMLLQDPAIVLQVAVIVTVNAFDNVTMHDANSAMCTHLELLVAV
jgi:hypothetical protein